MRDELDQFDSQSSFWTPPRVDSAIAMTKRPLGPHRLHQRQDANDLHRTFQVVSEHMQAHFRTDAWQCLGEEMRRAHPRFECAEGMLDGLSAQSGRLWRSVQAILHCL